MSCVEMNVFQLLNCAVKLVMYADAGALTRYALFIVRTKGCGALLPDIQSLKLRIVFAILVY